MSLDHATSRPGGKYYEVVIIVQWAYVGGPSCLLVQTGLLFSWGSAMDGREMILSNANEREVIPTCVLSNKHIHTKEVLLLILLPQLKHLQTYTNALSPVEVL